MKNLSEKYPVEIKEILEKYPQEQKRSAVMPLLYMAQRDGMHVSKEAITEIAQMLEISETEVASIIGFYTLYYEKEEGKYRIQVCTDLPCALRGADDFMAKLCEALELDGDGGTTKDGLITVEPVMCLAACDKAPMFQLQSGEGLAYHENQTVESTMELVKKLKETK